MKKILILIALFFIACGEDDASNVAKSIENGFRKGDISKIEKVLDYDYFIEKHNKDVKNAENILAPMKEYILDSNYYVLKKGLDEKIVVAFKMIDDKIYKTYWDVYLENNKYKTKANNLYSNAKDIAMYISYINDNEKTNFYNKVVRGIAKYYSKNKAFSDDIGIMLGEESKDKKLSFGNIKPCLNLSFNVENETLELRKINEKFPTCKNFVHKDEFLEDINPYINFMKAIKIKFI